MKALAWLGAGILAITLLRVAAQAGLVLILVMVVVCLIRNPVETLKIFAGLVLIGAIASYPLAGLLLCAAIIFAGALVPRSDK
ncbi:hypothetical protein G6N82_05970 [Altererythrobacter sp. BO-6]|uniref:hypothetical protein n=1 Tax=Altererythrobacter sp. BO-6 TaxID=2604537 RepID=UPI0013E10D3E|nr:hypothetical protein [Altererythrobacter sp. BO-6]QIG53760.1 hypothetical protein G6N82_05970 [Altererythrobacter sp. BO-6]